MFNIFESRKLIVIIFNRLVILDIFINVVLINNNYFHRLGITGLFINTTLINNYYLLIPH